MSSGFISCSWRVLSWQVQHLVLPRHGWSTTFQITSAGAWGLLVAAGFAGPALLALPALGPAGGFGVQDAVLTRAWGRGTRREQQPCWELCSSAGLPLRGKEGPYLCFVGWPSVVPVGPNPVMEPAGMERTYRASDIHLLGGENSSVSGLYCV